MRLRFWHRGSQSRPAASPSLPPAAPAVMTHRQFLKVVLGTVGGAGIGLAGAAVRTAEATYTPGSPSDTVDTNLTVQGDLIVGPAGTGNVGIGTTDPRGKLDVAGDICINGQKAIDVDGIVKQCYYAP